MKPRGSFKSRREPAARERTPVGAGGRRAGGPRLDPDGCLPQPDDAPCAAADLMNLHGACGERPPGPQGVALLRPAGSRLTGGGATARFPGGAHLREPTWTTSVAQSTGRRRRAPWFETGFDELDRAPAGVDVPRSSTEACCSRGRGAGRPDLLPAPGAAARAAELVHQPGGGRLPLEVLAAPAHRACGVPRCGCRPATSLGFDRRRLDGWTRASSRPDLLRPPPPPAASSRLRV